MQSSSPHRAQELSPRQFVNDLLGSQAFEHGDAVARHRPLELHLQVSSGCNLDCYMCHEHLRPENARHGRGLRFLGPELFERVEREVLPYSTRLHLGVGGEPMLAPNFLEIVERSHARNQRVQLTTNGTRIATERVAEVLARCVSTIEISADGATAETYERVRGGASFARLLQNLALLNRHRLQYEAPERARLSLCMVLMRSNAHELPRFVELAAQQHADGVAAWPVIPVTDEGRADRFDPVLARPFLDEARERARDLGIELDLPFEHRSETAPQGPRSEALRQLDELERGTSKASVSASASPRVFCHMPTVALYVFWDGRVYPCANPEAHQGSALGNLAEQSFDEIWNGRRFRNLRAGLARGEAPEVCRRCPILQRAAPTSAGVIPGDASSDLVDWFGERDLAPLANGEAVDGLVEEVVASGLAEQVQKRFARLDQYARGLEATSRSLEQEVDKLEHRNASVDARREALELERWHLARHAAVLEGEREPLVRHVRNLERILARIRGRAIYRALAGVKDVFVRPHPRPPEPYVPPWVADGSRRPGEPLAPLQDPEPLPHTKNGKGPDGQP